MPLMELDPLDDDPPWIGNALSYPCRAGNTADYEVKLKIILVILEETRPLYSNHLKRVRPHP